MLRGRFISSFVFVFAVATVFFYVQYKAVCDIPLTYRIGALDAEFSIDMATASAAVDEAVAAWEEVLGRDVFVAGSGDVDVTINFTYDERQARTDAEARERERLASVEAQSDEVQAAYAAKVAELEEREEAYETRAARYERELARYNATVAEYNSEGGAPPEVYQELEREAARLNAEATALNTELSAINDFIKQLNELGEQGNSLISNFNNRVNDFNDLFADGREFTQGDYQDGNIHIYSYADGTELRLVLVHELGHALGIEHTEESDDVMYYLLDEQAGYYPTSGDAAAFVATCSQEARLSRVPQPWRTLFALLGV